MASERILPTIHSPADVKALPFEALGGLCGEIREALIQTISQNGGHLASNLGVVELTLALHRVFSSPKDQIVWDVGHQCYPHKLLTGRYDQFSTLRRENRPLRFLPAGGKRARPVYIRPFEYVDFGGFRPC